MFCSLKLKNLGFKAKSNTPYNYVELFACFTTVAFDFFVGFFKVQLAVVVVCLVRDTALGAGGGF